MPVPWILWVRVHDVCLMATCVSRFLFCWLLGVHLEIPVAKVIRVIHQDDMQPPLAMDTPKSFLLNIQLQIFKAHATIQNQVVVSNICFMFIPKWGRFPF